MGRSSRAQRRRVGQREERRNILVVCEGATEVAYCRVLARGRKALRVCNEHRSASALVEKARRIAERLEPPCTSKWLVFDRDENEDFADAVRSASDSGFGVAWSNPCFELWLLLHFRDVQAEVDYIRMIEKELFKEDGRTAEYRKGDESLMARILGDGSVEEAMRRAEHLRANRMGENCNDPRRVGSPPCTAVDRLVRDILSLSHVE